MSLSNTNSRAQIKSISNASFEKTGEEKLHDLKDTAELIAEALTTVLEPIDENRHNFSSIADSVSSEQRTPQTPISANEFNEMAMQVFNKFRRAIVSCFLVFKFIIQIDFDYSLKSQKHQ